MTTVVEKNKKYSYEDYATMSDDKRYELVEGELIKTPLSTPKHQMISGRVEYKIRACIFFAVLVFSTNCFAFEPAPPLTDREIIESLTELKAGQTSLNKRFDDMNKRFDDMNKRFDDMNKRFDDTGKRIDDMKGLLYAILAGIFILIGFVLWDRRTTLAPTVKKYDALERALIDYSDKHPDLKESLRHVGPL